jgi:hypothetical protein
MIRITETCGEVVGEYETREAALRYIGDVQLQGPVADALGFVREAIWRKHADGGGVHTGYLVTCPSTNLATPTY